MEFHWNRESDFNSEIPTHWMLLILGLVEENKMVYIAQFPGRPWIQC